MRLADLHLEYLTIFDIAERNVALASVQFNVIGAFHICFVVERDSQRMDHQSTVWRHRRRMYGSHLFIRVWDVELDFNRAVALTENILSARI